MESGKNGKLKITVLDYFKNQECKQVKQLYIFLEFKNSSSSTLAKDSKFKLACGTEAEDKHGHWDMLQEKSAR